MEKPPDYTKCSYDELLDVKARVNRDAYPERARAVDDEILRRQLRAAGQQDGPGAAALPVKLVEPLAVKPGRARSMKHGFGALVGVVIGVALFLYGREQESGWLFSLFALVFIVTSLVDVAYHFNNTFRRNRFSEFDVTSPGRESDPLAQALGYERGTAGAVQGSPMHFPRGFCPYCGVQVPTAADHCPGCGKDV